MMYLVGLCNIQLVTFGFLNTFLVNIQDLSWVFNYPKELFFFVVVVLICFYSLYKLFNYQEDEGESKQMRCPECGKEPYKVLKLGTGGVTLSQRIRGYLNCIHCGTHLRRRYPKVVYVGFFIATLSYISIYAVLFLVSFRDRQELFVWSLSILGIVMLISFLTVLFFMLTKTRFVRVDAED
jgi:hypothetical protein